MRILTTESLPSVPRVCLRNESNFIHVFHYSTWTACSRNLPQTPLHFIGYLKFFKPQQHSFYKSQRERCCVFPPPPLSSSICRSLHRRMWCQCPSSSSTAIISTFHLGSGERAWRIAHAPSVEGRWKVIGNDRQTQPPSQPTIDGDRELDFDAWPTTHPAIRYSNPQGDRAYDITEWQQHF